MKRVLNNIIHKVKQVLLKTDTCIGENIRLLCEAIEYTANHNKSGILFLQTFKKHLIALITILLMKS
jgi:hypothetical protein